MTLEEFVKKYNGSKVDYDGVYENQCVDLIKAYEKEVLETPITTGDAKDYARNQYPAYFQYHKNDPWYIPPVGAIAIWNEKAGNGRGHVAIVLKASLMKFTALTQNGVSKTPTEVREFKYTNVVGFLNPRQRNALTAYNTLREEIIKLYSKFPEIKS